MKVAQEDLKVGDLILIAINSTFQTAKVVKINKSGSFNCLVEDSFAHVKEFYYDFTLDEERLTKKKYVAAPWRVYDQRYFWLIKREN